MVQISVQLSALFYVFKAKVILITSKICAEIGTEKCTCVKYTLLKSAAVTLM